MEAERCFEEAVIMVGDDLPLMSSPWPVFCIVCAYLYFVLRLGPRLMANRQAYSLRPVIAGYNLGQVLASVWFVWRLHRVARGQFLLCHCQPASLSPQDAREINFLSYLYFLCKIIELADTVFFVLRKKVRQVTFLHVYHHSNMVLLTWYFLKEVPGSQLMIISFCNTLVHVLMYGYYLLASLGPSVRRYLRWKRYLTRIQILQFLAIMGFMGSLFFVPGCCVPTTIFIISICNTGSFFGLFVYFYLKEYSRKKSHH